MSTANAGRATKNISLTWDVFLSPSIPAIAIDLAPGEKERSWPPISSTLISGERDAVLVDTPITIEQARALACREAGITNFTFHDLRHTFGTRLADAGVDVVKIKELMGHSSIVTTMRYITQPTRESVGRSLS